MGLGTANNLISILDRFPRFPLTFLPTPLTRASNLERALGPGSPDIWIKRDDLTGLAFGGNKARKLEYLVGDARTKGATALITEGAAQSNHARQTAAAAVLAGLRCALILDTRRGSEPTGNLFLDRLLGAELHLVASSDDRKRMMAAVESAMLAAGEKPYVIPTGGSVPIGALGYARCFAELLSQLDDVGARPRSLYFATGSLGTHAGLAAGAAITGSEIEIRGIAVEGSIESFQAPGAQLTNDTLLMMNSDIQVGPEQIIVDDSQVGAGYGIPTEACLAAIRLLARTEAIILDPVYTAKAMAGLLADVRSGRIGEGDSVIFVHTGGGPSLFANLDSVATVLDS